MFWRVGVFPALLALVGCDTAGPHFGDVPATRLSIDGATFDVRVNGRLAEAIRVNPQYAPRLGALAPRAARAMQIVSGCEVTEVRGDAAQITGILDCGEGPPPVILVVGLNYDCVAIDGYFSSNDDTTFVDYDCEAVPY